ncbi:MAG: NAD(P)H-binding protein [Steroidobacteraceae bacterium]
MFRVVVTEGSFLGRRVLGDRVGRAAIRPPRTLRYTPLVRICYVRRRREGPPQQQGIHHESPDPRTRHPVPSPWSPPRAPPAPRPVARPVRGQARAGRRRHRRHRPGSGQAGAGLGYAVRVLVRNAEAARPLLGDKVQYAVGNVRDTAAVAKAFKGVTYVISALGSNSQRLIRTSRSSSTTAARGNLAEAAKAAGVKQFVLVSSIGVTHADHPLNKMFDNIMSWKLKGEDALRAGGVPYTVVRPGGLANDPAGKTTLVASQGDTVSTGASPARRRPRSASRRSARPARSARPSR